MLRLLSETPHVVVAVATTLDVDGAEGATVMNLARRLGLPLIDSSVVREGAFGDSIRSQGVDLLLNVNSLHVAVAETVAAPRIGSFNLHPGPLPEYAGLNAPSWAIYSGEARHAVTLHWMTAEVDAGSIAYRSSFPIEARETGLSLTLKCVEHGVTLVSQLLRDAACGAQIPALEQDPTGRRYFGREVPDGGVARWVRPARQILDFVRACDYLPFSSPWGHPRSAIAPPGSGWLEIVKVSPTGEPTRESPGMVVRAEESGIVVAAGDERLIIEQVRVDQEYVAPGRILRPGLQLEPDPGSLTSSP